VEYHEEICNMKTITQPYDYAEPRFVEFKDRMLKLSTERSGLNLVLPNRGLSKKRNEAKA
jgi:hypothetical protein